MYALRECVVAFDEFVVLCRDIIAVAVAVAVAVTAAHTDAVSIVVAAAAAAVAAKEVIIGVVVVILEKLCQAHARHNPDRHEVCQYQLCRWVGMRMGSKTQNKAKRNTYCCSSRCGKCTRWA